MKKFYFETAMQEVESLQKTSTCCVAATFLGFLTNLYDGDLTVGLAARIHFLVTYLSIAVTK